MWSCLLFQSVHTIDHMIKVGLSLREKSCEQVQRGYSKKKYFKTIMWYIFYLYVDIGKRIRLKRLLCFYHPEAAQCSHTWITNNAVCNRASTHTIQYAIIPENHTMLCATSHITKTYQNVCNYISTTHHNVCNHVM